MHAVQAGAHAGTNHTFQTQAQFFMARTFCAPPIFPSRHLLDPPSSPQMRLRRSVAVVAFVACFATLLVRCAEVGLLGMSQNFAMYSLGVLFEAGEWQSQAAGSAEWGLNRRCVCSGG